MIVLSCYSYLFSSVSVFLFVCFFTFRLVFWDLYLLLSLIINPPRNICQALRWVLALCMSWGSCLSGAQAWMSCWGKPGDSTHHQSLDMFLISHGYSVPDQSLGTRSQRLMHCQSGCDGSKITLRDDRNLERKIIKSKVKWVRHSGTYWAGMLECQWQGGSVSILDLPGLNMAAGYGCFKTWAMLSKSKWACPKLFI